MAINIDKKEYSSTKWYAGTLTDAAGYNHIFNIEVSCDYTPGSEIIEDVHWLEEPPTLDDKSNKVIEEQIKETFYGRSNK